MTQQNSEDLESMRTNFTSVMSSIEERMSCFEAELQKSTRNPNSIPSLTSLATDFNSFRSLVLETMGAFRRQMELLAREVDYMEMRSRRKMLMFHGVVEQKDEDTSQALLDVVKNHLHLDNFTVDDIKRCHRMGRQSGGRDPRPVLVKFERVMVRDKIWFAKTNLKGSGKTVSEFLTRTRHEIFMMAGERFGVSKTWTKGGQIFVLDTDGSRYRISSLSELDRLKISKPSFAKAAAPKSRRAATKK